MRDRLVRARERCELHPGMLAADTAHGAADMLGWLVEEQGNEPHIPVCHCPAVDRSGIDERGYVRAQGRNFSATDVVCDHGADQYRCPGGQVLKPCWRNLSKGRPTFGKDGFKKYFARKHDCAARPLKPRRTPNRTTRKISRSRHETARQKAREIAKTDAHAASSYAKKKGERLFAHLERIIGLDRLRLRGSNGAQDEFHLAATSRSSGLGPSRSNPQPR